MTKKTIPSFCPASQSEWRDWLVENHLKEDAVWLILYKKSSGVPSVAWSETVDEALCFAWIDSVKKSIDSEKYMQYFGKRKTKSNWSKINKIKIEKLIKDGLMTPAGLKSIEIAKKNGSWTILDSVEDLIIPDELEHAFKQHPQAKEFYLSLSNSIKKQLLYWIVSAKRPETKSKRIDEIITHALQGKKPNQFR